MPCLSIVAIQGFAPSSLDFGFNPDSFAAVAISAWIAYTFLIPKDVIASANCFALPFIPSGAGDGLLGVAAGVCPGAGLGAAASCRIEPSFCIALSNALSVLRSSSFFLITCSVSSVFLP